MPQVSEEDQVKVLRPEVDDRHLVLGLPLGGLEHADRLDPDAACHFASGRQLESSNHLEWRNDLSQMAVIAVVFMADNDHVGRLIDRQIASRVRRAIGIEDDPQALSFDQERGMAIPGDAHGRVIFLEGVECSGPSFQSNEQGSGPGRLTSGSVH